MITPICIPSALRGRETPCADHAHTVLQCLTGRCVAGQNRTPRPHRPRCRWSRHRYTPWHTGTAVPTLQTSGEPLDRGALLCACMGGRGGPSAVAEGGIGGASGVAKGSRAAEGGSSASGNTPHLVRGRVRVRVGVRVRVRVRLEQLGEHAAPVRGARGAAVSTAAIACGRHSGPTAGPRVSVACMLTRMDY